MARRPRAEGNPELRPIDSHHNELSEEDKARLFSAGVERAERLREIKDRAVAEIRQHRKQMKADGFELVDLDDALKMRKKGQDWAVERVEAQIRIARWLGHPLGFQANLFEVAAQ